MNVSAFCTSVTREKALFHDFSLQIYNKLLTWKNIFSQFLNQRTFLLDFYHAINNDLFCINEDYALIKHYELNRFSRSNYAFYIENCAFCII